MTQSWHHALRERGILPEPGAPWPELEAARAREQRKAAPRQSAPLSCVGVWLYPDGYAEVRATPAEPFHTLAQQHGLTVNAAGLLEVTGLTDWLHPVFPAPVAALLAAVRPGYADHYQVWTNLDAAGRANSALITERWQPYVTALAAELTAAGFPVHPYYAWTDNDPDYRRYDYAALELALPADGLALRRLAVVFEADQVRLQLETRPAPPLWRRTEQVLWQAEVYAYLTGDQALLPLIQQHYETERNLTHE